MNSVLFTCGSQDSAEPNLKTDFGEAQECGMETLV